MDKESISNHYDITLLLYVQDVYFKINQFLARFLLYDFLSLILKKNKIVINFATCWISNSVSRVYTYEHEI